MKREIYKTDIEEKMYQALKENKIKAVFNFPIRSKHGYILDFAIVDLKIDIETDGEHYHKLNNPRDRKRNWVLRKMGWKVLRFRGREIHENMDECIKIIKVCIKSEGGNLKYGKV